MPSETHSTDLVGRMADERLLDEDSDKLPAALGRPPELPRHATRGRIVGIGATLTGITLVGGIGLIALGVVSAISGGSSLGILAIVLGVILAGTHWGWVHVAEATADTVEGRRNAPIAARRREWLQTVEPFTRYDITTGVTDEGSVTIDRVEHRPVPIGADGFTFERRAERLAVYSGDGAAAAVAEHAERLRQETAAATERARAEFQIAADAHQRESLQESEQQQEVAVRRAASEALSERINSHLREPPVD
jgi:hypothetical protein